MRHLKTIVFFLCFLTLFQRARGVHIVGGEINYEYIGNDQYIIRMSLFMDCINGMTKLIIDDLNAPLDIFDGSTYKIIDELSHHVSGQGPQRIAKMNYSCMNIAPNACVDHFWFDTVLTLPPRPGGYFISYHRCCRNATITNLNRPQNTAVNYWTYIPDSRTLPDKKPNSSAVFMELPPNFLCTNTPFKFNHGAIDKDGDSLVYDFFWPYRGDFSQDLVQNTGQLSEDHVRYMYGYDFEKPMDGNPSLSIDPESGFISMVPTREGQYVVGIRVREYRNGMLISETKRDYQFNVSDCSVDMVAIFYAPKYVCGYTHTFDNKTSGDPRLHWDFGIPDITGDTSTSENPTFVFPKAGKYTVRLYAYKGGCIDSFVKDIYVLDPAKPKLPADTVICVGTNISYSCDVVGDSYQWNTGERTRSIEVSKQGSYWLELTIKTCKWSDTVAVFVDKDKVKGFGDTVYCTYDTFDHWLIASNGFFNYRWSIGSKLDRIMVDRKGDYIIYAVTVHNCPSFDTIFVEHYPPVLVEVQDTIVCPDVLVTFDARNSDAEIEWGTGDSGQFFMTSASGAYKVTVTRGKCHDQDTFRLSNFPLEFSLGSDLRFCGIVDTWITLDTNRFYDALWQGYHHGFEYHLTEPGALFVQVRNIYGCLESDAIYVSVFQNSGLNLGNDASICSAINPILDAGPNVVSYRWQDNRTERYYEVFEQGLYWVEVIGKEGCKSRDSILIEKIPDLYPSMVYMPTAFTPNGNSVNDFYPDNKFHDLGLFYEVKLFNRWGQKIADFNSPSLNWDGNLNGVPAPEGVYAYLVTWIGCDNRRRTLFGNFQLMR